MGWKLFSVVAVLLAVGAALFVVVRMGDTPSDRSITLSPPSVLAQTTGFPSSQAGLAVTGNLGVVSYERLFSAMALLVQVKGSDGATYLWGVRKVQGFISGEFDWTDDIGLYSDTNGLIIAFFLRGSPTATLGFWRQQADRLADDNTLEEALKPLVLQLGVQFSALKPTLRYSHFEFPNATAITFFAAYGNKKVSFLVPNGLILYESSYNILVPRCCSPELYLNDKILADFSYYRYRKTGRFGGVPEKRNDNFRLSGGSPAGTVYSWKVPNPPILDTNGDGVVTPADVVVNADFVRLESVDTRAGVFTARVVVASAFDRDFSASYTTSRVPPIYASEPYAIEIKGDQVRAAFVLVWGAQ